MIPVVGARTRPVGKLGETENWVGEKLEIVGLTSTAWLREKTSVALSWFPYEIRGLCAFW
ncbi:hypothetical protein LPTSP4_19070 [Leptospira ryugenii]|uniref:Uncharacterized protein n=1 Tax=Leptospira ryugenii TaxID=1917863 RepID=A0A2P2E0I6_9LEPT|nr:hypothetical protein LPTSP4_19070 [Leptospira ryugenii]